MSTSSEEVDRERNAHGEQRHNQREENEVPLETEVENRIISEARVNLLVTKYLSYIKRMEFGEGATC